MIFDFQAEFWIRDYKSLIKFHYMRQTNIFSDWFMKGKYDPVLVGFSMWFRWFEDWIIWWLTIPILLMFSMENLVFISVVPFLYYYRDFVLPISPNY